jgi:hypothetical protein
VPGVGFLNHVHGKHPDGVDAQVVNVHTLEAFPGYFTAESAENKLKRFNPEEIAKTASPARR